ncbi:MAG: isoleucine--tRNA ligase [Acidobacteriota bacterium]|nr:isoleucine--tRNA ligase [Acidobacteriota bacterium]MDH3522851.1 isoleucine--tRNA ligase [Acidobacteriota bacterium]
MSGEDFPALEREILEFWEREDCFRKLVEQNRGKPTWSFLDGPITANNPMGVHHAWGRTYKDLYQRFWAMTGRELRYQNGFDCQGLWVEVEVEKELGFTSKRDIEEYGIDRFVEKCKERVVKYAAIQTRQSIRLGYWMDWDDSYFTMSDENNYTIWEFLKRCHQRGFLYHGHDSMPWCPRCGTGISQHEIHGEDRPELTHASPTVRFPIRGREREYLLVWTTTPWTLTANVACAVQPELAYARVRQGGDVYYLVRERVEAVMSGQGAFEVLGELRGEELVGWEYEGPFDELPAQAGVEHRVIPWKEVAAEEGTGIVHIAPGCGKEDYELGREHDLPAIGPIDESGVFVAGFGPLSGTSAPDAGEPIFAALRAKGILYDLEDYTHSYPVCWRCKTPLLFRLVDEWFLDMGSYDAETGEATGLRKEIMEVTRQTRWIPEVGLRLELEWLQNMQDWMISKKRYWGLALPIYLCRECGVFDVVGSKDELRERAVQGWEEFAGHSPHRPWVDAVRIACPGCSRPVARIPEVGNPWLDAGIVPYSTMHYNTDRAHWQKWFPADWVSESHPGQFRNWFYAILAMSTVMENRPPFKLLFGYRLMQDEHGEEMHKTKGNAIEFNEAADLVGADPMRWLYATHNPDYDLWFGYHKIRDAWRDFLVLWNVHQFYLTYSRVDGFDPARAEIPISARPDLDRWILSRLGKLVASARDNYSGYSVHLLMREVVSFIDALSRWYLRRSRRRIWKTEDDADKSAAYRTLWECLVTTVKVVAPVVPFVSERMYQELVREKDAGAPVSVHLCSFPEAGDFAVDEDLLGVMDAVRSLVELGHAARNNAGIKVRQPVRELRVHGADSRLPGRIGPHVPIVLDELNVKELSFVDRADDLFERTVRLDGKVAGPKYKRLLAPLKRALAAADGAEVERRVAAGLPVVLDADGQRLEVPPDEILVAKDPAAGWAIAEKGELFVALATELDAELLREGRVRDLVRAIQNLRKEIGLNVEDRIRLTYAASDEVAADVEAHRDYIAAETLATELARAASLAAGHQLTVDRQSLTVDVQVAD